MDINCNCHLYFTTATIHKWITLLEDDFNKELVLSSLKFLVEKKRVRIFAFVIMPNHIHIIWEILEGNKREDVQRDLLKFTSQKLIFRLKDLKSSLLNKFIVNLKDRNFQIWQRNSLSIPLWTKEVIEQKVDYIHENPLKGRWNLSSTPESYPYSSADFYLNNERQFNFLTHYMDC
ncbi:MAG: transposase [Chitinophagales bacterium]